MSTRLEQRRARLRAEYGFDFPDDFYRFWDFVSRLAPLDPLAGLAETLDVRLVGPFEVLSGRFDGRVPRHSLLLHWRYYGDPPEFFTVLAGGSDGLHWGYFLDDPPHDTSCVASYYARDAYELSANGDTLFEAVRLHLEYCHSDQTDYLELDPGGKATYEAALGNLEHLRRRLMEYATVDQPEVGDEYTERYANTNRRSKSVVARTMEGMGVVVPPSVYRPLSMEDRRLWRYLRRTRNPQDVVNEARRALADGFPGTALKLGKDLWATSGTIKADYACELLESAYAAMGRTILGEVLQTHRANRELPSVDILENEEA
jgi:hypothetical protein